MGKKTDVVVIVEGKVEGEVVEMKPKRVRKIAPKVQKTGSEIVSEIQKLEDELKALEIAVDEVDPNSILHPFAKDLFIAKSEEVAKAINTVYTI